MLRSGTSHPLDEWIFYACILSHPEGVGGGSSSFKKIQNKVQWGGEPRSLKFHTMGQKSGSPKLGHSTLWNFTVLRTVSLCYPCISGNGDIPSRLCMFTSFLEFLLPLGLVWDFSPMVPFYLLTSFTILLLPPVLRFWFVNLQYTLPFTYPLLCPDTPPPKLKFMAFSLLSSLQEYMGLLSFTSLQ